MSDNDRIPMVPDVESVERWGEWWWQLTGDGRVWVVQVVVAPDKHKALYWWSDGGNAERVESIDAERWQGPCVKAEKLQAERDKSLQGGLIYLKDTNAKAARIEELEQGIARMKSRLKGQRDALWMVLDDIDTIDDLSKDNEAAYRDQVRRLVAKRHGVVEAAEVDPSTSEIPGAPGGLQTNLPSTARPGKN